MGLFEAVVLGLVQGLTEFLPISSSAHLRIVGEFLPGAEDPGAAFTAIIQLGTETAVLVYFWRDIRRITARFVLGLLGTKGADGAARVPRTDPDYRMGWFIVIGSLPIVVLGVLLQDAIETTFRSLWIVAVNLVVFGVLIALADLYARNRKTLDQLSARDGVVFGFAQALALVPGVSRSGGTIGAGLVLGYTREAAARYSFLLALPAVFGSGFYQLFKVLRADCEGAGTGAGCPPEVFSGLETLVATVVAFGVGLAVIAFFLRYISHGSFMPFMAYRILLGLLLIGLLMAGLIQP